MKNKNSNWKYIIQKATKVHISDCPLHSYAQQIRMWLVVIVNTFHSISHFILIATVIIYLV